ncbi:MAG: sulfatase-like hydrolase/transferase [bacterium]|nr:sulfatase-like hydrolase/transferase [bacterium]
MRRLVAVLFILVSFPILAFYYGYPAGRYPHVKNIILIVVDTFTAQHLGFMGYDRGTSPFMDELASRSVVFERAYTPESKTEPAFTSILTGLHPATHGVVDNGSRLPDDLHFLTQDFRDAGFTTWGIPAADVINGRYGFFNKFDFYSQAPPVPLPASKVINKITGLLENHPRFGEPEFDISGPPLFLMLHFYDPHTEYTPDENILAQYIEPDYDGTVDGTWEQFNKYNNYEIEFDAADLQRVEDMYDAEIRTFDNRLRELFDLFERTGLLDDSVIVLTADHGENLGEHHFITHGLPYEASLHIPLLIHFPDDMWGGARIDNLVENTDILPTLMEIASVPVPENLDGQSLISLIDPDSHSLNADSEYTDREYLFSLGYKPGSELPTTNPPQISYSDVTYSIFDGTHRLTMKFNPDLSPEAGFEPALFDIKLDPNEATDILSQDHDRNQVQEPLLTLTPILDRMILSSHQRLASEMDPETLQMLASLGYL